jgi:cytochrome P450
MSTAVLLFLMQAAHQDVQQQVFEELQQAGLATTTSSLGKPFSAGDLNRLPLLSAVIRESLRLCTPVPFGSSRHVVDEEGAEVCGYHIPKVSWELSRPSLDKSFCTLTLGISSFFLS